MRDEVTGCYWQTETQNSSNERTKWGGRAKNMEWGSVISSFRVCLNSSDRPLTSLLIGRTAALLTFALSLLSLQQWSSWWVKWASCWRCWTRRASAPLQRRRRRPCGTSCSRYSHQVRMSWWIKTESVGSPRMFPWMGPAAFIRQYYLISYKINKSKLIHFLFFGLKN